MICLASVHRILLWSVVGEIPQALHEDCEINPLSSFRLVNECDFCQIIYVKRRIIAIAGLALVAVIVAYWVFNRPAATVNAPLPNPNGYDDFAAAAQSLVGWGNGELLAFPPEEMERVLELNVEVLEVVHRGLRKRSAVPVQNSVSWVNAHMAQIANHKSIAKLLVTQGLVYWRAGRTNEAAVSFALCIKFGHKATHGGLIIDDLVGIACQAIGSSRLVEVAPSLSPDVAQQVIAELISLDQTREPAGAIIQRDRQWSRRAYGLWRTMWTGIVANKTLRSVEESFRNKHTRSVAALRLVTTALAIRAYEATNGKRPTSLAELVPQWLPAVPLDPFSQQPLAYRFSTNAFLLYSLGPDGKDDGGMPLQKGEIQKGDLLPGAF